MNRVPIYGRFLEFNIPYTAVVQQNAVLGI